MPEPAQKKQEKNEVPADSLEKEEKTEKVVPKVSSKEERSKGEKVVAKDPPKAAIESNENPNMDDSDPQLNKNDKIVKKKVVEMERLANEKLNMQDSNDHGNKNSKTGDINKNVPDLERHPDMKHNVIANINKIQEENSQKRDHDVIKQSQSHHENDIASKQEKLDFVANEKLTSSHNKSQNNIPAFVSKNI